MGDVFSPIWTSQICLWWFDLEIKPILETVPAASKKEACFKSGQNQLKNNHLDTTI
jgi:hypothetical protein